MLHRDLQSTRKIHKSHSSPSQIPRCSLLHKISTFQIGFFRCNFDHNSLPPSPHSDQFFTNFSNFSRRKETKKKKRRKNRNTCFILEWQKRTFPQNLIDSSLHKIPPKFEGFYHFSNDNERGEEKSLRKHSRPKNLKIFHSIRSKKPSRSVYITFRISPLPAGFENPSLAIRFSPPDSLLEKIARYCVDYETIGEYFVHDESRRNGGTKATDGPEASTVSYKRTRPETASGGKPEGWRKIEQPTSRLQGHCARTIPTLPIRHLAPTTRPPITRRGPIGASPRRPPRHTRPPN